MYLHAALLGIVQGLTEFLPVSSSAHLILARMFFGWDAEQFGLAFDVACHVGTLVAVVAYFRIDVLRLSMAAPAALLGAGGEAGRLGRLIIAGTAPTVVVGLIAADAIEAYTRTPFVAALALSVGAVGLLVAERLVPRRRDEWSLTLPEAFAIGCAQAAALVPGVSRAGATITVAMLLGLRRDAGARFTFLLSIPAILGAALHAGAGLADAGVGGAAAGLFLVGLLASAVVGYVTIKYFLRYLAQHSLDLFAWYRLGLAAATFAWLLAR